MAKQVKVYTTATNPDTGETVNLAPGDEAPSWAKLGDHVYTDPDESATPTEPVAGPSQSALSRAQLAELERQLEATDDSGAAQLTQTRTSGESSAAAKQGGSNKGKS